MISGIFDIICDLCSLNFALLTYLISNQQKNDDSIEQREEERGNLNDFSQILAADENIKEKEFQNFLNDDDEEGDWEPKSPNKIYGNNPNNEIETPPLNCPDVINILENFDKSTNLPSAFQLYKPRSKIIDIEALTNSEFCKIKRYKDCIYMGEFINSKRHGKGFICFIHCSFYSFIGIMIHTDGRIYEGEWQNNIKHGTGVDISQSGNKYEGEFINGKANGEGLYLWQNGESYEGEWKNGLKHGSGMWKGTKGESFLGEWKYGKADGYGVHIWTNGINFYSSVKYFSGDKYEGEFKSFLKHGHGTEKFSSGDLYVGNYVNGKPDGYGEYYWKSGELYKGFFKNGLRHGKGAWRKTPNKGDKYDGEWLNDKKSGHGEYMWECGNYYKGNYFSDLRNGYGEMIWTDDSIYKGNWEKGIQQGEGELIVPNEATKKGLFNNNIFIGDNESLQIHPPELKESQEYQVMLKINSKHKEEVARSRTSSHKDAFTQMTDGESKDGSFFYIKKTNKSMFPYITPKRNVINKTSNPASRSPIRKEINKNSNSASKSPERKAYHELNYSKMQSNCLLTKRELFKWMRTKDTLRINPNRYRNLNDPEICSQIRKLMNPPLWKPVNDIKNNK